MATGRYRYSQLSGSRQIRLLKLHPRGGQEDPELIIDLITVSLDAAPPFEALSYAWGDRLPQADILCCGLTANIGLSLHSGLCQLRPLTAEPERLIWADALCINQEDIAERNAQVRIMGDIYSRATNTLIWLGEEDDDVARAMGLLHRFRGVWDTLGLPDFSWGQMQSLVVQFGGENNAQVESIFRAAFGGHPKHLHACRDIWMLLRRPWFTRKWVIQEVAKSAKHRMVLMAGSKTVTWSAIQAWFTFLTIPDVVATFLSSCPWGTGTRSAGSPNVWSDYTRVRTLALMGVNDAPLMYLLANTLTFRCTDPRDHIIALLGISSDSLVHEDLVDYGVPAEQLYRRLARNCLTNSRDLRMLWSFLSGVPISQRAPCSWLPNIEELPTMQSLAVDLKGYAGHGDAFRMTEIHVPITGNQLQMRGRIVDRIEQLGMDISGFPAMQQFQEATFTDNYKELLGRMDRWLDECRAIAESAGQDEDGFRATILTEALFKNTMPLTLSTAKQDFPAYRRAQKALLSAVDEKAWYEAMALSQVIESRTRLDMVLMLMRMLHRRFCRTRNGRIGWVPSVAETGDYICLFDDMEYPYAVRESEVVGGYALVGECYISGLMPGEATDVPVAQSLIINLE